jgi:CHASE3 domain sensor protein
LLDRANQKISTYNLTQNDLGETDNYDHLKELLVGAATAEGETDVYYQQDQELERAVSLIDRDQSSQTDDDYLEALDEVLEMWW